MYEERTYEGAKAAKLTNEQSLRRSVLSCLLWENTFYELGESIAHRIENLSNEVDPKIVASLAIEARTKYNLRSVPLLLAKTLAKTGKPYVRKVLNEIIKRPDEITKFMELYWEKGKSPISKQVKLGLADAFKKFNEYQLAKWNRDGSVRLRDVMFLTHPKPETESMAMLWNKLAENTLDVPDTWEVGLSSATSTGEKKEVWERLLSENKLGALALLKNLRNMQKVGVSRYNIEDALIRINTEKIFPYRFITASRYASEFNELLEAAMFKCLAGKEKIAGKTILLVDVSGSMDDQLSSNTHSIESLTTRMDTAAGLAVLMRQLCEDVEIFTFSADLVKVSDSKGFALVNNIIHSQRHGWTNLGKALTNLYKIEKDFDRIAIFTDEQSHDEIPKTKINGLGYIINVAPYRNGIDYSTEWTRITGFSDRKSVV